MASDVAMNPAARLIFTLLLTAGLAVTLAWWMAKPAEEDPDAGPILSKWDSRSAGDSVQPSSGASNSEQSLSSRLRQLVTEKPAGWQAEIARLLRGVDLSAFPGLMDEISAAAYLKETERFLLDELFVAWGKRHPESAMVAAIGAREADDVSAVLRGWATVGEEDAWRWVALNVANSDGLLGRIKPDYYAAVLGALVAEGNRETAFHFANTKAEPSLLRATLITHYAGILADHDPAAASSFLKTLQPEDEDALSGSIGRVGVRLSVRGPDELILRLAEHNEVTQKRLIEGALTGWVMRNERDSLGRFLAAVPDLPEATFDSMMARLGTLFARSNAPEALRALRQVRNVAARDAALEQAATMAMGADNPQGAIELINAVAGESRRNRRLSVILNQWIVKDKTAAEEYMLGSGIPEAIKSQLKGL